MADDKFSDSPDGSDESTSLPPTGAELADGDLTASGATAVGASSDAPELSATADIDDPADTPDDAYVDDPATTDVNEAKLDRATDEAAAEPTVAPGSTSQRRPRANRPVRRRPAASEGVAAEAVDEPAELTKADEIEATPVRSERRTVARKGRATPGRTSGHPATTGERTTPAKFVGESVGELRKVVWPTGNQVQQYFIVVLVFVLFIIAFVSLLDLAFGWALLKVFG